MPQKDRKSEGKKKGGGGEQDRIKVIKAKTSVVDFLLNLVESKTETFNLKFSFCGLRLHIAK